MRRCLDCRRLFQPSKRGKSRCVDCRSSRKSIRNADRPVAAEQVARTPYCECEGCNVCTGRPCSSLDLTAEHVTPLKHGGTNEGRRKTLCRPCNSRRRDRGGQI